MDDDQPEPVLHLFATAITAEEIVAVLLAEAEELGLIDPPDQG